VHASAEEHCDSWLCTCILISCILLSCTSISAGIPSIQGIEHVTAEPLCCTQSSFACWLNPWFHILSQLCSVHPTPTFRRLPSEFQDVKVRRRKGLGGSHSGH